MIHPAPGSDGRPSFTALVANVDSESAKYVAETRVQTSRQEIIEDLRDMAKVGVIIIYIQRVLITCFLKAILIKYITYREQIERRPNRFPKRIIFYRGLCSNFSIPIIY